MPPRLLATVLLAACALACSAAPLARAADGVEIRWQWNKGDVLRYRLSTEQRATQGSGEDALETRQDARLVWRLTVQDVDATGRASVLCRFESVAIDMAQMALGQVAWDSEKPADAARADEPAIGPFSKLVGKEFGISLGADGHVYDVSGYDKILREILAPVGDNPTARAALTSGYGPEWARASLERAFAIGPEGAVAAGAGWTRTSVQEVPLLGPLRYSTAYALERVEKGVAAIATKTQLSVEPKNATGSASPGAAGELEGRIVIDWDGGEGTGSVRFDVSGGRLEKSEQTLRMSLRTRVLPPIAPGDGPGVKVAITQKSTVERLVEGGPGGQK